MAGKCHLIDDFEHIKARLLECDGFIFTSPNYVHNVTAQMQAFFDRCCSLIHCFGLEGKYGAVVETSGSEDDDVLMYMMRVGNTVGAQSVGGIGSL